MSDDCCSRRKLLKTSLLGAAGLAGGSALAWHLFRTAEQQVVTEVFKHDAPADELWQAWQQRGWVC